VARLIYSVIASLDGYIEDEDGRFDWAAPDDEVHAFVNELERSVGTYLYGRRMYETMVYWERPARSRRAGVRSAGVRGDLADGGQGRLLEDAADRDERQDADRA
jgi:dihydrofolate reductase